MMTVRKQSRSEDLPGALTASFSAGQVRHGRDDDIVDGLLPPAVITPRDVREVLSVVDTAAAEKLAILPAGGGSMIDLGNRPLAYDVRLAVKGLSQIVERRPADLNVTVGAGVGLNRLNRVLEADGQRVAIDPPDDDLATVGGLIATNRTGGYAYGYGQPRDLILGLEMVDGCGRVLRVGGTVVKNVAGYDLVRLATGSHGTLGVITEVTLRTHPIPEDAVSVRYVFESVQELDSARAAVFAAPLQPAAFDLAADRSSSGHTWSMNLRLEGSRSEVTASVEQANRLLGAQPRETSRDWESAIHAQSDETVVLRFGAQPDRLAAVTAKLLEIAEKRTGRVRAAGRLGDGLGRVFISGQVSAPEEIVREGREALASDSVRLVAERIPESAKTTLDVWGEPPAGMEIMRAVKGVFDPSGLFSPGRFVGGV